MPTFNFQGRNVEGELISGVRLAQSSDALAEQLLKENITPISIQAEKVVPHLWQALKEWIPGRRTSIEDLSIFSRQMYTLYSSGVPLTLALKQLAHTIYNPQISNALLGIIENVEAGKDLANAMEDFPRVFSPIMISMVRVGQNTGRLDEAFLNLHHYLELESIAFKQIKTTARYPIFILCSLLVAVVIIVMFVIPTFARVFAQANIPLPGMTLALVSLSEFFIHNWVWVFLFLFAGVGSILYYLRTPEGEYQWHRLILHLPIVGNMLRQIFLLRFAQSFSVIIKSGIPLVDGLGLVAQSVQNKYARQQISEMQQEIQRGKTLTQAAAVVTLFTPLEIQMLAVSEETGELSSIMEHLSQFYQREVDYNLKRLNDIIEPLLILGVAVLVLGLALTVYLPIWNLVKMVHT